MGAMPLFANAMVSSGPHVAPRGAPGLAPRVRAAPPLAEIFFSDPTTKKPIHSPSGEKNGFEAPFVPARGVASNASIERTYNWPPAAPVLEATYTRRLPSSEISNTAAPGATRVFSGSGDTNRWMGCDRA